MSDAHAEAADAAVVVPVRRRGAALEVFWARRADTLSFLGGFWAFIGGRVEPEDLGGGDEDVFRRAAVREVEEEIGVVLPPSALISAGRTITPTWSPARYDARYFLADLGEGARPDVSRSGGELTEGEWITPAEAVRAWTKGERLTGPVLVAVLDALAEGWDGAGARVADGLARVGGSRVWELLPGIDTAMLRSPTLPPARHTNVWLVGGAELVVIDPGTPWEGELEALATDLEAMATRGRRVRAIWLTHHHVDHASGAPWLAARLGVPVVAHPVTAELLAGRVHVDRTIDDGHVELLPGHGRTPERRLRAIFTPGHAPGHHVFLEETTGFMVAGDMVAGLGTIVIDPPEGDMKLYLASLARMRALAPRALLPAHGPVLAAADAVLDHYARHRLGREAKVVAALAACPAPATVDELVPVVYADVDRAIHPIAARSLLAHLGKLVDEGRVTVAGTRYALR